MRLLTSVGIMPIELPEIDKAAINDSDVTLAMQSFPCLQTHSDPKLVYLEHLDMFQPAQTIQLHCNLYEIESTFT